MKVSTRIAELEALLFIHGEPLAIKRISALFKTDEESVREAIRALQARGEEERSGLTLIEHDGALQLVTKPVFGKIAEAIVKEELQEALTPAATETLAIVIYGVSLPRSTIDYIRGVNSSFILRMLLLRGLVERSVDAARANVYRYAPSFELLRHLGISRVEELSEFGRLHDLVVKIGTPHAA